MPSVVATPYNDHLCIAVAQELENAFGGCCHSVQRSPVYRRRQGTGEWLRWLRASLCCCLILLITNMSVQVVATPYNDHLCIAVTKELENAFGGYIVATPYNDHLCIAVAKELENVFGGYVVATLYNDHLCIAVAKELENAFGGYVPPCAVVSYYL
ncbi:hypothetical protein J6590_028252 [Homalodisca vitripennis]|nr:hypothetical protein J6590_028252 [Homalodisca vitripennis]